MRLGFLERACENIDLMRRLFPYYYNYLDLAVKYAKCLRIDKVEEILVSGKIDREDYYDIVRRMISLYKEYIKDKSYLETPDDIYLSYLKNKKTNLKQVKETATKTILSEQNQIDSSDFHLDVLYLYQNGGMEEVFSLYSLDELYKNLTLEELASMQLVKTK